ncbi:DUF305 domain-containing protein [Streptomyces tubercidicus]|uniref:DUF305 domain-containing protein n=1 Tax=Streptomyces tubercidicus TaxID=47759 RepID=UPI002E1595B1|nr:DUF305 domain-containing protein [Streptomyces tubercidicus]WSX24496.1 DUF305 domain-containing protein [Streptomyces tubercidicus]
MSRGTSTRRTPVLIAAGVALALVAALVVWWRTAEGTANASTPGEQSAEVGFARDMAVHHQQAVEMSFIVRDRTDDQEVRTLAYDVINTQATQRGMMLGWLETWDRNKTSTEPPMTWMGHGGMYEAKDGSLMPGMATNAQLDQLRKAEGRDAEVLYLRLMTAHHKGGIDMARGAVKMADDQKVKRLAQTMVNGQQSEIDLMADMLAQRDAEADQ